MVYSEFVFPQARITGRVFERSTHQPLPNANVLLLGTPFGAASGPDGHFVISNVPAGDYTIEASVIGYESKQIAHVRVEENSSVELDFALVSSVLPLQAVVVTPGHFAIMHEEAAVRQTLNREDIRSIPQFGEDIYRAVTRLPGVAGNDFSSKFTVRGGENEELLVLLDGQELYEPFHLKDFGGALSIIDVEAIGGIDLMTGGFPAEYGDKLSGVFNIVSASPPANRNRTSLGISFMNARFMSEGPFGKGKGQWLVSARRGYIDLVLKLVGSEDKLSPQYYDLLGKVEYQFSNNQILSAHVLRAGDVFDFESDDHDKVNSDWGNSYGWLTLKSFLHPKLFAQSVLSVGRVDQNRQGAEFSFKNEAMRERVSDIRAFNFYGLKQDWHYQWSDRYLFKWGFEVKRFTTNYDYFNRNRTFVQVAPNNFMATVDSTQVNRNPLGNEMGAYVAERIRLFSPLTVETGVRYDSESYTTDKTFSPRFNLVYAFKPQSALRVGWGRFYQSQGIQEMQVQDGEDRFYPAELAEHRVIGLEHVFENGLNLRVEAYQKRLSHVRPRYQNLSDDLEIFPEFDDSRVRIEPTQGEAKGFEVFLRKDTGGRFSWWLSYAWAFAKEEIDGRTVARNFDQRHTFYLDCNYRPNKKWRINVAWQFHSGWPFCLLLGSVGSCDARFVRPLGCSWAGWSSGKCSLPARSRLFSPLVRELTSNRVKQDARFLVKLHYGFRLPGSRGSWRVQTM
ncbi:MAG: TonB-dependent receptor domain-containing protein [bacterium]